MPNPNPNPNPNPKPKPSQAIIAVNAITAPGGGGEAGLSKLRFDAPVTADARVLAAPP